MYSPLEEPSPLGLRLKKTPSFLDLIEMKLSQGNASKLANLSKKRGNAASSSVDKLKASNFPGSLLKIGSWEYNSRYEGGLVAKCYFAKHKLAWEVLDGGLKNKMKFSGRILWLSRLTIRTMSPGSWMLCLLGNPFSSGRQIRIPESILYGRQHQILLVDKQVSIDISSNLKREEGSVCFDLQHAASPSGVQSSSSNIEHDFFNSSTSSGDSINSPADYSQSSSATISANVDSSHPSSKFEGKISFGSSM